MKKLSGISGPLNECYCFQNQNSTLQAFDLTLVCGKKSCSDVVLWHYMQVTVRILVASGRYALLSLLVLHCTVWDFLLLFVRDLECKAQLLPYIHVEQNVQKSCTDVCHSKMSMLRLSFPHVSSLLKHILLFCCHQGAIWASYCLFCVGFLF